MDWANIQLQRNTEKDLKVNIEELLRKIKWMILEREEKDWISDQDNKDDIQLLPLGETDKTN